MRRWSSALPAVRAGAGRQYRSRSGSCADAQYFLYATQHRLSFIQRGRASSSPISEKIPQSICALRAAPPGS
jgi:hypothetical protein